MFLCRRHWFSLRRAVRQAIWREYKPGQEDTKTPSPRYMAVQQLAIAELVFAPNDEKAAAEALPYIENSEKWRRVCIDRGLGDPLAGLVKPS